MDNTREGETKDMRGHNRKLSKGRCLHNMKLSFSQINVDTWNELREEVREAECVH